jgi:hypothetical protein
VQGVIKDSITIPVLLSYSLDWWHRLAMRRTMLTFKDETNSPLRTTCADGLDSPPGSYRG